MSWQEALDYCEELDWGEADDWRLPNVGELHSLVDFRFSPRIDTEAFPAAPLDEQYWTSTSLSGLPLQAWNVSFGTGFASKGSSKGTVPGEYVRCVRGGP